MCWSHWGLHGNIFAQGSWINAQYMWYFIQLWSWSELCDWVLEWLGLTEKLSGGVALVPGWTYTINSTTSHSHQVCLNTKTPQLANSVYWNLYIYKFFTIIQRLQSKTIGLAVREQRVHTSVDISKYIIALFWECDFVDCVSDEASFQ